MYILYTDESGDPTGATDENFILAGIAAFERQTFWLSQKVDSLETEIFGPYDPTKPQAIPRPVEFHASAINARKSPPWDQMNAKQARSILSSMAGIVSDSHDSCALFAIVVHRPSFNSDDPVLLAFNELTSRFDLFLTRQHNRGDTQRGLMVFDESRHEQRLQQVLRSYATEGGPFGRVRNFCDVPFFADSRASRMLQLADFIAWATFRRYETGNTLYFDQIANRFDSESNRIHGLHHRTSIFQSCSCLACFSRRAI